MLAFALRRLVSLVVTLAVASALIFAVLEVLPGDVAEVILGVNATPERVAALRMELGLDRPALVRYGEWIAGLLQGDLGLSYVRPRPVADILADRLWVNLPLALFALLLTVLAAVPLGTFAAGRRGRAADYGVMGLLQVGMAVPNFWIGLLLVEVFAIALHWLPSISFPGWDAGFWRALGALILPAVALAIPQAAVLARVMRAALLDVLGEDFIRTARAKGLSRRAVLLRHAFRNALVPVVTIIGLQFAFLVSGTVIIEAVFSLPGVGRLVFQAVADRDLAVVRGVVLLLVASVVVVSALVDLAYAVIDPRIRTRTA